LYKDNKKILRNFVKTTLKPAIMSEETKKDPRDLNDDGKVTLDEKIKYAAGKAGEKLGEVAEEMKENAKELYEKAAPKAKEIYGEMKENAAELVGKAKEGAADLMGKARDKMDEAKDIIDSLKEKKA
jgi:uncharacterized protein YjbJ (UPF0337 family)